MNIKQIILEEIDRERLERLAELGDEEAQREIARHLR